jgi:hypothetical protein
LGISNWNCWCKAVAQNPLKFSPYFSCAILIHIKEAGFEDGSGLLGENMALREQVQTFKSWLSN